MTLIKPTKLRPGDTLGLVACSAPISGVGPEVLERCFSRLRDLGFTVVEAPNCRKTFGHAAGTIEERARVLNDFFCDPKINGIISFWGGHQSHQLLPHLDFDMIRKNPKVFVGYSDTTSLQVGIHQMTGLVTFSGPAGITFGKPTVPEFTTDFFRKTLMELNDTLELPAAQEFSDNPWFADPDKLMHFKPNPGWNVYRKGVVIVEGRIVGGNMGTMLLFAGTKYWPDLNDKILFVEEDESESTGTIDRMFTQLRHMGVFDEIKALVVGRFHSEVKFKTDDTLEMILDEALRGYDLPVITGVDFGHTDPLLTIPLGIRCQVDASKPEIRFLESGVC